LKFGKLFNIIVILHDDFCTASADALQVLGLGHFPSG